MPIFCLLGIFEPKPIWLDFLSLKIPRGLFSSPILFDGIYSLALSNKGIKNAHIWLELNEGGIQNEKLNKRGDFNQNGSKADAMSIKMCQPGVWSRLGWKMVPADRITSIGEIKRVGGRWKAKKEQKWPNGSNGVGWGGMGGGGVKRKKKATKKVEKKVRKKRRWRLNT